MLDKARAKADAFGKFFTKLGTTVAGFAAGAGLSVGALLTGGVQRGAEIARMAERFGLPIRLMSKLKHVADEAGESVEAVMSDTSGRFSAAIAAAPAMNDTDARRALELQKDWNRALHDLQDAMLPLLGLSGPLASEFANLARGMKETTAEIKITGDAAKDKGILRGALLGPLGSYLAAKGEAAKAADAAKKFDPLTGAELAKLMAVFKAAQMQSPGIAGAFQTYGTFQSRFGFGSQVGDAQKQTELMKQLLKLAEKAPKEIGDAVKAALVPK